MKRTAAVLPKARASARPDRTSEAAAEAALWRGRLERAVAGTTAPLKNHVAIERIAIPDGPMVALLFAFLDEMPRSLDAATIQNHAKNAMTWLRWLAETETPQRGALLPDTVAAYQAHLESPRAAWFPTRDKLGRRAMRYERRAPEVGTVRNQISAVGALWDFARRRALAHGATSNTMEVSRGRRFV